MDPFTLMAIMAAISAVGTGYSIYSGVDAAKKQREAQAKAESEALKNEQLQTEAMNKQNQKRPNISAILAANQAGAGGINSTILRDRYALGQSSLLGG